VLAKFFDEATVSSTRKKLTFSDADGAYINGYLWEDSSGDPWVILYSLHYPAANADKLLTLQVAQDASLNYELYNYMGVEKAVQGGANATFNINRSPIFIKSSRTTAQTEADFEAATITLDRSDSLKPVVSILNAPRGSLTNGEQVEFRFIAIDADSVTDDDDVRIQYKWKLNGGGHSEDFQVSWQDTNYAVYAISATGSYTFEVKAKDEANNESNIVKYVDGELQTETGILIHVVG
jgi:hypothetical protein